MILVILLLSALIAASLFIFCNSRVTKLLTVIFSLVFIGAIVGIVANQNRHFGMHQVTQTKVKTLQSSAEMQGAHLLLYKSIGTGTEKVFIYKTDVHQKQPLVTGTTTVTNHVQKHARTASIKQRVTMWQYDNKLYEALFAPITQNHQRIRTQNSFQLTKSWYVLSTKQAKKLQQIAKAKQTQLAAKAKQFVQAKLMAQLQQDPAMTAAEQQQYIKQVTADYEQQTLRQLIKSVK